MATTGHLLDLLRERGRLPAREVLSSLGISQPSLSRLTRAAGDRVLQIGRARATRYALAREVRTFGHAWPVYRIDVEGRARVAGTLRALHPDGWWLETLDPELSRLPPADVPWLLDDLRPAGFLGGAFARRHARMLGLAPDPVEWNGDGVLAALLLHGHDLPGDVVLGDDALERVQHAALDDVAAVPEVQRSSAWARRANAILAGDEPGAWLGGAQPKLAACVRGGDGIRHVVVKFSPRDDTPAARRWRDLLRCEHLASIVLRAHGVAACETDWLEDDGRAFLEIRRFDRVGAHGRRGVVSLRALGASGAWHAVADGLRRDGVLGPDDARALAVRGWFGRLIGDTGMHAGNAAVLLDGRIAPAWGLSPAHRSPTATGELVDAPFVPPMPPPQHRDAWLAAARIATELWQYVAEDAHLSDDFREDAERTCAALDAITRRV